MGLERLVSRTDNSRITTTVSIDNSPGVNQFSSLLLHMKKEVPVCQLVSPLQTRLRCALSRTAGKNVSALTLSARHHWQAAGRWTGSETRTSQVHDHCITQRLPAVEGKSRMFVGSFPRICAEKCRALPDRCDRPCQGASRQRAERSPALVGGYLFSVAPRNQVFRWLNTLGARETSQHSSITWSNERKNLVSIGR